MSDGQHFYQIFDTAFGAVAVGWWRSPSGPRVCRVCLTRRGIGAEQAILRARPGAERRSAAGIDRLGAMIRRFLAGGAVEFDLEMISLEGCGEFQRRVLLAEYGIPRGWVSTYGRIAVKIGAGRGARAVGRALATNPFPIVIPCHRAVTADGSIGGYQGGVAMKRALLAMEGTLFTAGGRVVLDRVFY